MQEFRCCSQNIPPPLGLRETTRFIVDYSARTTSTTTDNFFPSSSSSRQCPNAHAACSGRRLKKAMLFDKPWDSNDDDDDDNDPDSKCAVNIFPLVQAPTSDGLSSAGADTECGSAVRWL